MATLSAQVTSLTGLNPTFAAADNAGDVFATTGKQILVVKNGDAASHTVTINDPNSAPPTAAKQFDADVDVAVPAGEERWIGPFDRARFEDSADSMVHVSYSAVTGMEVALVRLG